MRRRTAIPRTMIELAQLLEGEPNQIEISDYFKNGEFYEESYLVRAIKKHLLADDQKQTLFQLNVSIEDILNGRAEVDEAGGHKINLILKNWNNKLGFESFQLIY